MHVMLFAIVSIMVVGCAFCMHVRAKCRKVCCSDGEEEDEEESEMDYHDVSDAVITDNMDSSE